MGYSSVHKSWKAGAEGLEVAGAGLLFLFVLFFPKFYKCGEYIPLFVMFVLGVLCVVAGKKVKKWAKKNGKK